MCLLPGWGVLACLCGAGDTLFDHCTVDQSLLCQLVEALLAIDAKLTGYSRDLDHTTRVSVRMRAKANIHALIHI